jgi:hypothetical protein
VSMVVEKCRSMVTEKRRSASPFSGAVRVPGDGGSLGALLVFA